MGYSPENTVIIIIIYSTNQTIKIIITNNLKTIHNQTNAKELPCPTMTIRDNRARCSN